MRILLWVCTILYPLLVYVGLTSGYRVATVAALGLVVAIRAHQTLIRYPSVGVRILVAALLGGGIVALSLALHRAPLFFPVAVNGCLALIFGASMVRPPSVIERVARAMKGDLPPEGVVYCRRVCMVWIVFFLCNGGIALDSAFRSLEWWAWYNGAISYLAIGALAGGEYLVRRRVMSRVVMTASGVALGLLVSYGSLVGIERAFADQELVDHVRERLKPKTPFRAEFTEKRFVAVLSAPLEFRGEIRCLPGAGLIWRREKPLVTTDLITRRGVTRVDARRRAVSSVDRVGISDALLSLMSGEVARAQETFTLDVSGTPDQWVLTLKPKDSLVAEMIQAIVVSGARYPEGLEVRHADGDTIRTTFSQPVPLSTAEIAQAEEALHAAS